MARSSTPRTRTIAEAKAHFAECIREAEAGHSIIITRHGRAVARFGPVREPRGGDGERQGIGMEEVAEPASPYGTGVPLLSQSPQARRTALRSLLAEQIWPRIPREMLGRGVSKQEREEILGYAAATGVRSKDGGHDRR